MVVIYQSTKPTKVNINKNNPIISEKHQKASATEILSARTWSKKQFWGFAGSINLRGASGDVKILLDQVEIDQQFCH